MTRDPLDILGVIAALAVLFAATFYMVTMAHANADNLMQMPVYRLVVVNKSGTIVLWSKAEDLSRDECLARLKTFKKGTKVFCVYSVEKREIS
jgi:hypothetical protein